MVKCLLKNSRQSLDMISKGREKVKSKNLHCPNSNFVVGKKLMELLTFKYSQLGYNELSRTSTKRSFARYTLEFVITEFDCSSNFVPGCVCADDDHFSILVKKF